jgi:hypothetical protein
MESIRSRKVRTLQPSIPPLRVKFTFEGLTKEQKRAGVGPAQLSRQRYDNPSPYAARFLPSTSRWMGLPMRR